MSHDVFFMTEMNIIGCTKYTGRNTGIIFRIDIFALYSIYATNNFIQPLLSETKIAKAIYKYKTSPNYQLCTGVSLSMAIKKNQGSFNSVKS